MTDKNIEKRIKEIEERLSKLEEENNILKIELGNSIIEKYYLDEAKQTFIDRHITQTAKMEEQVEEEINQLQEYIKIMKNRCEELERENKIFLSERTKGMLKEVVKQAKMSKRKTGKNPFELLDE